MSEMVTIARPYAKAVFESALENKTLKSWSSALEVLALTANDPLMKQMLANPSVSKEQQADLFIDVDGKALEEESKNLVRLLASKRRLNLLPTIAKLFEAHVAEYEKKIEVKVVSAYPIDATRLQRLQKALQDKLQRQVTLECAVDKSLLGGAIIYAGDRVIDGSLRNKLRRLSERLCS